MIRKGLVSDLRRIGSAYGPLIRILLQPGQQLSRIRQLAVLHSTYLHVLRYLVFFQVLLLVMQSPCIAGEARREHVRPMKSCGILSPFLVQHFSPQQDQ